MSTNRVRSHAENNIKRELSEKEGERGEKSGGGEESVRVKKWSRR